MNWSDAVTASFGLAGVLIGSLITVWFQSKDRQERLAHEIKLETQRKQLWIDQQWWQKKADAYTQVVAALWDALNAYQYRFAIEAGEASRPSDDRLSELDMKAGNTWQMIRQASDIGEFVISSEVSDALRKLSKALEANDHVYAPDWFSYFDACVADTKKCLETVRGAALRDLGVRNEERP